MFVSKLLIKDFFYLSFCPCIDLIFEVIDQEAHPIKPCFDTVFNLSP